MYVRCMYNDDCEELTKELIAYKLYNNGQTPVLPKYDLTIYKRTIHECMNSYNLSADSHTKKTQGDNYYIISYN